MTADCVDHLQRTDWDDVLECELAKWWLKSVYARMPKADLEYNVLDYARAASVTADGGCDGTKGE